MPNCAKPTHRTNHSPPAQGRRGEVAEIVVRSLLAISFVVSAIGVIGCNRETVEQTSVQLTSSGIRAQRRAYDGAPPVIPHKLQTAVCTTCHTEIGKAIPNMGFAPANPHASTPFAGSVQNCKQCHVFARDRKLFAKTSFTGLAQNLRRGERQYAGAPPVMPHGTLMRENCRACHTGNAARPEIRCSHPQRTNCRQCHVRSLTSNQETWPNS